MTADAHCPHCKGAGSVSDGSPSSMYGQRFTTCWRCGGDGLRNGPLVLTSEGPKRIEVKDAD